MNVYSETLEGKSSSESMVKFLEVRNFNVGSIDLRAMKILRCICATLRLDVSLEGQISRVTGVVNILLIRTAIVETSMVLCALVGAYWWGDVMNAFILRVC